MSDITDSARALLSEMTPFLDAAAERQRARRVVLFRLKADATETHCGTCPARWVNFLRCGLSGDDLQQDDKGPLRTEECRAAEEQMLVPIDVLVRVEQERDEAIKRAAAADSRDNRWVRERNEARHATAEAVARAEKAEFCHRKLVQFAETVRDGFDCDEDAHKKNTFCRCCAAEKVLKECTMSEPPFRLADARKVSEVRFTALADSSYYMRSHSLGGRRYHHLAVNGYLRSACGIPHLVDFGHRPAQDVPITLRCRKAGCRSLWPKEEKPQ